MTYRRPGGTSGQACLRQPPSPRQGPLREGGTATWWPGAGGTAPRPLRPPRLGRGAHRRAAPHFADAEEEQQLWEELRGHSASLHRVLNEALRIHGGPAWRVFQVRRCSCVVPLVCLFPL
jgi:hypothetical protein